jgi:hypothetical protein
VPLSLLLLPFAEPPLLSSSASSESGTSSDLPRVERDRGRNDALALLAAREDDLQFSEGGTPPEMYLLPLLRGFLVAEGGEQLPALPLLRPEVARFCHNFSRVRAPVHVLYNGTV